MNTPTPWLVDKYGHVCTKLREDGQAWSGSHVLVIGFSLSGGNEERANTALIVRAVNSHQALVDALEPFADIGGDLTNAMCHKGICSAEKCARCSKVFAARAALKLARGES